MPDSQPRTTEYQRHADQAAAKAEGTTDPVLRRHYMRVAETYQLVELELRRAEIRKPPDLPI